MTVSPRPSYVASKDVILNQYGFYELKHKPTEQEIQEYYANKYYQTNQGSYQNTYSEDEKKYLDNKILQKFIALKTHCKVNLGDSSNSLLDIGSGEGFALKFFHKLGWDVLGLDYSTHGCEMQNPDMLDNMEIGDIPDNIRQLISVGKQFEIVWLDNVLEHVLDPHALLNNIKSLVADNGVLVIEVPNDFSALQAILLKSGAIPDPFWVTPPDHVSYFNKDGLVNICKSAGWDSKFIMSDFPIDIALLNPSTNYIKDRKNGRNVHLARIAFENLLHDQSVEKTNSLYEALCELGLGRQLIGLFQKQ